MKRKISKKAVLPAVKSVWSQEKLDAFAAELDAVHQDVKAKMGPEDVAYAKKLRKISRAAQISGRALIHLSLDPLTWSTGVFFLWLNKQLEATEIGHSALHGCWDGIKGAEDFYSARFQWDTPIEEESWKAGHNIAHHQYTNIVGRDPDVNFGFLRTSEKTPWSPHHWLQLGQFIFGAPLFIWLLNPYFTGLGDLFRKPHEEGYTDVLPDRSLKTILAASGKSVKKLVPYFLKNFVFWPALAGPFWWKVFGGNAAADVIRNIYTCATIYSGHFGADLVYHDKDFRPQGRGEWYKMQVESAHNYDVPVAISRLCGALDLQIEHHLFPKMPPNRLREISPKVREICERYGVRYNHTTWGGTLKCTVARLIEMSKPARRPRLQKQARPERAGRKVVHLKRAA